MLRRLRANPVVAVATATALVLQGTPARADLTSQGSQGWSQDSAGVGSSAEAEDVFGRALAAGDFNGDGRDDLAVGVPGEEYAGLPGAGVVQVLYGEGNGLATNKVDYWTQNTGQVPGAAEADDAFGRALAAADFNGDGWDDLAVGVPGEPIGSETGAGAVVILYSDGDGLTDVGSTRRYQGAPGLYGSAGKYDHFGWTLAAGDFDGDGYADLAVGAPFENMGSLPVVGVVHVLYGSGSGITASGDQMWAADSPGVPGDGEWFGYAPAAGDFDGDGRDDLAVGSPMTNVANGYAYSHAGTVTVLYGTSCCLATNLVFPSGHDRDPR